MTTQYEFSSSKYLLFFSVIKQMCGKPQSARARARVCVGEYRLQIQIAHFDKFVTVIWANTQQQAQSQAANI